MWGATNGIFARGKNHEKKKRKTKNESRADSTGHRRAALWQLLHQKKKKQKKRSTVRSKISSNLSSHAVCDNRGRTTGCGFCQMHDFMKDMYPLLTGTKSESAEFKGRVRIHMLKYIYI